MAILDTLTISRNLRDAGFTEKQADALTAAVRQAAGVDLSHLVTKADLLEAKNEILKWIFGMIMGSVLLNLVAVAGLIKLMH